MTFHTPAVGNLKHSSIPGEHIHTLRNQSTKAAGNKRLGRRGGKIRHTGAIMEGHPLSSALRHFSHTFQIRSLSFSPGKEKQTKKGAGCYCPGVGEKASADYNEKARERSRHSSFDH